LEGYSGAHEVVIPHMCDLPADNVLLPPPLNRQRGRPSKRRFRSDGEGFGGAVRKQQKCGRCGDPDHKKGNCTMAVDLSRYV